MRAFLLSAGLGKRLRPMTEVIPKCLVPINNKPLIEYWFKLFRKYKIIDVIINTHHLSEKIENYVQNNFKDLRITTTFEQDLLGSYGTILENINFFGNEKSFLVFYSDNLTNLNIADFISFHNSHNLPISMGIFACTNPNQCGIVELDKNHTIIDFEEKPLNPRGNLANAGAYIFDKLIFENHEIINNAILDISIHLLPRYIGQMKGFIIEDYLLDIGTYENYNLANEQVSRNPTMFL